MNIKAEYLVGQQKGNEWAGVYGYRPEDDINRKSTVNAEMFAVIRIETEAESKNLERISKMLLDELQEVYFEDNTSKDGILRIENAFNKMKAKLEVILSREEEILEKGIDIEIGAAFLQEETLYLGVVGESKVFIFRNNKLVDISGALVDANLSGFIKTGSLKVNESDIFCLATSNAALNKDALEQGVKNLNVNSMGNLKDGGGVAVLLFADEKLEWSKDEVIAEESNVEIPAPIVPVPMAQVSITNSDNIPSENPVEFNNESVFNEEFNDEDEEIEYDPLEEASPKVPFESAEGGIKGRLTSILGGIKFKTGNVTSRGNSMYSSEDLNSNDEVSPTSKVSSIFGNVKNKVSSVASEGIGSNANPSEQKTYIKILNDIIILIKRGVAAIVGIFRREILGHGVDRSNVVQYQNKIQRNRKILVVVLVVAVIFIYLGIRDSQAKIAEAERVEEVSSELASLQSEFGQLNSQVESVKNQDQGKKDLLLNRINEIISKAESLKAEGVFINDFDNLIDQAGLAKDNLQLIKEVNSENLQLISDIGKVHADSQPNDIVFTNGNIFVSDFKRGVVYKILPTLNSDPTEAANDLTSPSSLTLNNAGEIIFYDSDTSTTIGKINPTNGEVTRFPFLGKAVAGTITKAATYSGNDALYEIHQDHQQIFKRDRQGANYTGGGAIYTSANPPNWKTDLEFAKAIDIAVPYELYTLIEGGGLRRYLAGGDNTLTFETFSNLSRNDYEALNNANSFSIDGSTLAVSDSKNQRVLIFQIQDNEQKNLNFIRQFVFRGDSDTFKNIKEVTVNQATNSIFVLDGTKVVKLSL